MEKLTKKKAQEAIDAIIAESSDDEAAHSMEDNLREDFIKCLAEGMYSLAESQEIAKIVISSSDIDFHRWCA